MTVIDVAKIRALLERAGHPETPEAEARSCALIAAKLLYGKRWVLVDFEKAASALPDFEVWAEVDLKPPKR